MAYWQSMVHTGDELPKLSDPEGLDAHAIFNLGTSVPGGNKRGLYVARDDDGYAAIAPIGSITMWPVATPPLGWLVCDGSAIDRTTYADLFDILGIIYGSGDGSTTFNIPNFKGSVPVGTDSTQSEFVSEGTVGGEKTHTLSAAEMPSHTHTFSRSTSTGTATPRLGGTANGTVTTNSAGSGTAHNNLQPYITLNFIIKA